MRRRDFLATSGAAIATTTLTATKPAEAQTSQLQTDTLNNFNNSPSNSENKFIEQIINYDSPPQDELKRTFRFWHVEAMLNQASDLIERCLQQLKEYRSLDQAAAQATIELQSQTKDIALDQANVEMFKRDLITAQARSSFLQDSKANFDQSKKWADHLVSFDEGHGQGRNGKVRALQNQFEKNIEEQARNFEVGMIEKQINWATKDEKYKTDKLNLRQEILGMRQELSAPGRAMSFEWQRDLVSKRLLRDYTDALNRATIAEDGLLKIYGHHNKNDQDEIQTALPPDNLSTPDEKITHVAQWIRKSTQWLVAFHQSDQAFTRVVSIKNVLGDDRWEELRESENTFKAAFTLPSNLFAENENVRLRGVGAALIGKVDKLGMIPWSIVLRVPKNAVYIRSGAPIDIDQGEMPLCLLGRVENRQSYRPVEICGLISLMNASPIGRQSLKASVGQQPNEGAISEEESWLIEINRPMGTSETFKRIEDIVLEISVVGVPNKYAFKYI